MPHHLSPSLKSAPKAKQQIESDLELISTLSYLLLRLAKSEDDEVKLCAPILAHAGRLIHESGHRIAEILEDI